MSLVNLIKSQFPKDLNVTITLTEKGNYVVALPSVVANEPSNVGNQRDRIIKFMTERNFSKKDSPVKFKYLGWGESDGKTQIGFAYIPYKEVLEKENKAPAEEGAKEVVEKLYALASDPAAPKGERQNAFDKINTIINKNADLKAAINTNLLEKLQANINQESYKDEVDIPDFMKVPAEEMAFNIPFDPEEKGYVVAAVDNNNTVKEVKETPDKVLFTDKKGREWKITRGKTNYYIYSTQCPKEFSYNSLEALLKGIKETFFTGQFDNKEHKLNALRKIYDKMAAISSWWDIRFDEENVTFNVRSWGEWEVSEDDLNDPDYENEDFEDWDWKKLTPEYEYKLENILKEVNKQYGTKFGASASEKEWIAIGESAEASENVSVSYAMAGPQTCAPLGVSRAGTSVPDYFYDIVDAYNKYQATGLALEDIAEKICSEMHFNTDVFKEKFAGIFEADECISAYERYIDEDSEADDIRRRLKNKAKSISAEKAWKKYRTRYNAGIRRQENH